MAQPVHAETVFAEAIAIVSPQERVAFLDRACQEDPALRQEVEKLVVDYFRAGKFLESPIAHISAPTQDQPNLECPGAQIGPYKLLQVIGEGGMGTVFMAEQTEPLQRKVAIKVIKAGMDSRQVIARFEAERQALAVMDHVNIARVLDAGASDSGRPYFVMELVHGVPITKYCDDNHLTPRERLELFVPVCQAIQHAHQKGIIHRDIKPSNVMVTLYDGKPVPKVIDFGVAKATEQKLTERTLFTQYGAMVGTMEYMSPEQAEMSALGVDTRSDIYSLGVLLYELLTGSTPLSSKRMKVAAYAEILRLIKEEEPPKPSTRLSESGEALASISAQRHTEPAKLSKLMRGELDWIVMKCLEKDRNRRYETANGFAADVQRYLSDEPVQACPPSAVYRFRKFARRNRIAITTAVVVSVALVLGTFVSTWQAFRATRAEGLADERLKTANTNYETAEAQRQRAEASERDAKTQERLARAAQKDSAESLKDAVGAVDQMLTRVAEDRIRYVPQMESIRRDLLQDALQFNQKFLQQNSDDPVLRRETALAYRRTARIHHHLGQSAEAEVGYRKAIALVEALDGDIPLDPGLRTELTAIHIEFSWILGSLGKSEEQKDNIRRAVQIAEELHKEFPKDSNYSSNLANASNQLVVWTAQTQPQEAEKMLRRNLTLTDLPVNVGDTYRNLGNLFAIQGRLADAESAYREARSNFEKYAADNPTADWPQNALADAILALARSLSANGRPQEAEEMHRQAISILDKLVAGFSAGPHYRNSLAAAHVEHAGLLRKLNRSADAENAYRRAVELYGKLATDFPDTAEYQVHVANCYSQLGGLFARNNQAREAADAYRLAIVALDKLAADFPDPPARQANIGWTCRKLASLLARQPNQGSEAEKMHRRDIDVFEKLSAEFRDNASWPEQLAHGHRQWGYDLWQTGRSQQGDKSFRKAIDLLEKSAVEFPNAEPSHHDLLSDTYRVLVRLMATTGHAQESEQAIREIIKVLEQHIADDPNEHGYRGAVALAHNALGTLFKTEGRIPEAEQAHDRALDVLQKLSDDFPTVTLYRDDLILIHCDLGDLLQGAGRHQEAQSAYTRAVALNPTAPAAWFKRAAAFGSMGQWEQAAADISKVVEMDPKSAVGHNNLAWLLATCPEAKLRDPARAVEFAKKALELAPNLEGHWNTLGIAQHRAGDWPAAIEALTKSMELRKGGDAFDWFFLAMAHWQLDSKEEALKWFDQGTAWMEKNQPQNEELKRFRAEAAELLSVNVEDK